MTHRVCIIEHASCEVLADLDLERVPSQSEILSVRDGGVTTRRRVMFVVPHLSYHEVRVDLANKESPTSIESLTVDQANVLHEEASRILYPDLRETYTMGDVAVDVLEHALFTAWRLTQYGGGAPASNANAVEGPLDRIHRAFTGG